MRKITRKDKAELIRRCKKLAERQSARTQYYPARYSIQLYDDLRIIWRPDEACLHVTIKIPGLRAWDGWRLLVEERGDHRSWGYVHTLLRHLALMRRDMVLEDLSKI